MEPDLADRLATARARVGAACAAAGRDPGEVEILLAVKTQSTARVRAALAAGARLLGHNRAQELVAMGPELAGQPAHEMHFIGHLQTNKVNQVLRWATCVQTLDSMRLLERLDAAMARRLDDGTSVAPLGVFVQVNTSGEESKHGTAPELALDLAAAAGAAEHLQLRGLMTVGARSDDDAVVRSSYERLAGLRDAVVTGGAAGTAQADELSMGMSADLEAAVAAGATMVRLGTAVFGARPPA